MRNATVGKKTPEVIDPKRDMRATERGGGNAAYLLVGEDSSRLLSEKKERREVNLSISYRSRKEYRGVRMNRFPSGFSHCFREGQRKRREN